MIEKAVAFLYNKSAAERLQRNNNHYGGAT